MKVKDLIKGLKKQDKNKDMRVLLLKNSDCLDFEIALCDEYVLICVDNTDKLIDKEPTDLQSNSK